MFRFIYSNFRRQITHREPARTTIHFNLLFGVQNQNPYLKSCSNIPASTTNPPSITVEYLINSCGLPPPRALSVAEKIHLYSTEKSDSVISVFQNHGLTKTQIAELISKRPLVLIADPDKTLKPKIEFLRGVGFSGPSVAKLIASHPNFLLGSLQNKIIPLFNFLKSFMGDNADLVFTSNQWPRILHFNLDKILMPNISILRDHGVPDCIISKMLINKPRVLGMNKDRFKETVKTVEEMGFDPSSPMFVCAVKTMSNMSKSSWERKLIVYQEFGLSVNEILSGFKKHPNCMDISENKIRRLLEFYLEKLKWKPSDIMSRPWFLLFSLEKRIIPRCAVLEFLSSKGINSEKLKVSSILKMKESDFLERFVIKYQETAPEVMKAYNGGH